MQACGPPLLKSQVVLGGIEPKRSPTGSMQKADTGAIEPKTIRDKNHQAQRHCHCATGPAAILAIWTTKTLTNPILDLWQRSQISPEGPETARTDHNADLQAPIHQHQKETNTFKASFFLKNLKLMCSDWFGSSGKSWNAQSYARLTWLRPQNRTLKFQMKAFYHPRIARHFLPKSRVFSVKVTTSRLALLHKMH